MTLTKETWVGLAGVAALLAYFFWPKKASAAVMTTTTPAKKPATTYKAPTATKPAETPFVPDGTPGPSDGSGPTDDGTAEAVKAVEGGFGEILEGAGIRGVRGAPGNYEGDRYRHGMPQSWWAASLPRVTGADLGMWTPPARTGQTVYHDSQSVGPKHRQASSDHGRRDGGYGFDVFRNPSFFQGWQTMQRAHAHAGAGPHVLPFGYQGTSVWPGPGPAPVLPIIPGFSDYDVGYNYGKAHCTTGAPLMMRPTNPSDDWLTGYDEGCKDARHHRHHDDD